MSDFDMELSDCGDETVELTANRMTTEAIPARPTAATTSIVRGNWLSRASF
jgi:hypothetical protein